MDMLSILSVIVKANGMDLSVRDGQIVASWPGANRVGEGRENTACDRNKTSQIVLYYIFTVIQKHSTGLIEGFEW